MSTDRVMNALRNLESTLVKDWSKHLCGSCSSFNVGKPAYYGQPAIACPFFPNVLPNAYACFHFTPIGATSITAKLTRKVVQETIDAMPSRFGPKPFPQPPPARVLK